MSDYVDKIKLFLQGKKNRYDNIISDKEYVELTNLFLKNLKICVDEKELKGFDILTEWYMEYNIDNGITDDGLYTTEIKKFYYDLIQEEKYEFIKNWSDREFGEIANAIILDEMEKKIRTIGDKLEEITKIDLKEFRDNIIGVFLENVLPVIGVWKDNFYYNSIKERMEAYIEYSLFYLDYFEEILVKKESTYRKYLPNRIYTDEMFRFTDKLYYEDGFKLYIAIEKTLEKFDKSIDKLESYRVRYDVYRKTIRKKCK